MWVFTGGTVGKACRDHSCFQPDEQADCLLSKNYPGQYLIFAHQALAGNILPMSENYLFVYGTLLKGTENLMAAYLRKRSQFVGPGRMRGEMYKVDFFPGVLYRPDSAQWITGQVYDLAQPDQVFAVLDGYEQYDPENREGSLFVRERCEVEVAGKWQACWVYLFNQPVTGLPPIPSGDYLRFEIDQV